MEPVRREGRRHDQGPADGPRQHPPARTRSLSVAAVRQPEDGQGEDAEQHEPVRQEHAPPEQQPRPDAERPGPGSDRDRSPGEQVQAPGRHRGEVVVGADPRPHDQRRQGEPGSSASGQVAAAEQVEGQQHRRHRRGAERHDDHGDPEGVVDPDAVERDERQQGARRVPGHVRVPVVDRGRRDALDEVVQCGGDVADLRRVVQVLALAPVHAAEAVAPVAEPERARPEPRRDGREHHDDAPREIAARPGQRRPEQHGRRDGDQEEGIEPRAPEGVERGPVHAHVVGEDGRDRHRGDHQHEADQCREHGRAGAGQHAATLSGEPRGRMVVPRERGRAPVAGPLDVRAGPARLRFGGCRITSGRATS